MKIKQREKTFKYLDLNRELKKLWSTWVTVIPFTVGALGTALTGLKSGLEIRGIIETN